MGNDLESPERRKARLEKEHRDLMRSCEESTARLALANADLRKRQDNDSGRWRCNVVGCCVAGPRPGSFDAAYTRVTR